MAPDVAHPIRRGHAALMEHQRICEHRDLQSSGTPTTRTRQGEGARSTRTPHVMRVRSRRTATQRTQKGPSLSTRTLR
jgi:hypothetical protein